MSERLYPSLSEGTRFWLYREPETFRIKELPQGLIQELGRSYVTNYNVLAATYDSIPDADFTDQLIIGIHSPLQDLRQVVKSLFLNLATIEGKYMQSYPSPVDINFLNKVELLSLFQKGATSFLNEYTHPSLAKRYFKNQTAFEVLLTQHDNFALQYGKFLKYRDVLRKNGYVLPRTPIEIDAWGNETPKSITTQSIDQLTQDWLNWKIPILPYDIENRESPDPLAVLRKHFIQRMLENLENYKRLEDPNAQDKPTGQGSTPKADLQHEVTNLFNRVAILFTNNYGPYPSREVIYGLDYVDLLNLYKRATRVLTAGLKRPEINSVLENTYDWYGKPKSGALLYFRALSHFNLHAGNLLIYRDLA